MWDIFRAKRGQQKHSTRMCLFMSSWSIALCGWLERSWRSTASLRVNRLPSAHFYWVSCVWLYLLTFIECVKYTSFALTSYLVSKLYFFIQTMPWSTGGIWSLWPCTSCTLVCILSQSEISTFNCFSLQMGRRKFRLSVRKNEERKRWGFYLVCKFKLLTSGSSDKTPPIRLQNKITGQG